VPVEDALAILQAENAALRAQLAERDAALDVANAQIEALSFNLAVLRRRQFGQSSERLAAEIEQLELRLKISKKAGQSKVRRVRRGNRSTPARAKPANRRSANRCRRICRARPLCMNRKLSAHAVIAIDPN
jgi:transposase